MEYGGMGRWVVGSEAVGRSLLERSLVIGHWWLHGCMFA